MLYFVYVIIPMGQLYPWLCCFVVLSIAT